MAIVTPQNDAINGQTPTDYSRIRSTLIKMRDAAKSERDRKSRERDWNRSERAYLGRIHSDVERVDGRAYTQSPKLWETVRRFLAILTDQRAKFEMEPIGGENTVTIQQMLAGADYLWDHLRMEKTCALWAKRAMKTGTSFLHTGVKDTSRGYMPYTNILRHTSVFPDPGATDDSDWAYCWIYVRLTLEQIQDLYGQKGVDLIAKRGIRPTEAPRSTVGGVLPGIGTGQGTYAQAGSAATIAAGTSGYNEQLIVSPQHGHADDTRYNVWECYIHDQSELEVEDQLDDGTPVTVAVRRYENPRWITMIEDNYDPSLDREYPCNHGEIPVIRLACDDDDNEFWAGGMIAPLIDNIELMADLMNSIVNAARLCGSPWWKVAADSGVKVDTIYGDAGQVIVFNPNTEVEMVAPPQLPQYLFELWRELNSIHNDASGISDISKGNLVGMPEGTSGKMVQLLQEPFLTVVRLFQKNFEFALSKWGHQMVSNLVQYWTPEQWMRVLPGQLAAQPMAFAKWTADDLRDMPKVKMTTGSSLPPNKQERTNSALALFNAGAFDPMKPAVAREELLKAADWPDYDSVVKEVSATPPPTPPGAQGPGPVERAQALSGLITAVANYVKDTGGPPPVMDLDGALNALGFPPWSVSPAGGVPVPPQEPATPPGPNKATGQGPSPESQMAVMANPNGQEIPNGPPNR